MKEVFIIFLEMSVCGSAAYLLYLLTVHSFGKRLSSAGRFVFLKAAALLFVLPISKLLSPLLSLTDRFAAANEPALPKDPAVITPQITLPDIPVQNTLPPVVTADPLAPNAPAAAETVAKSIDILALLAVIWIIGVAAMLAWRVICRLRFEYGSRRVLVPAGEEIMAMYRRCCESMGISRAIPVYTCEKVYTPMIVGAIRPKIILPQKEISQKSLEFVFRHELTHYQRGDIFSKIFASIVTALHWFNPLIHVFDREFIFRLELSCDERAGRSIDLDGRKDYCMAILEAVPVKRNADVGLIFGTSGKNKLKKRLDNILNFKKMRLSQKIIAAVVAVVIIAVACVLVAMVIPVDRSNDDGTDQLRYNVNSVTLEALSFEKYYLTDSEINEFFDALSLLDFSDVNEFEPWVGEPPAAGTPVIICTVETDSETLVIKFTGTDGTCITVERGDEAVIYDFRSDPVYQEKVRDVIIDTIVDKAGFDFSIENLYPDISDPENTDDAYETAEIVFPAHELDKTEYNAHIFEIPTFSARLSLPKGWKIGIPADGEKRFSELLWSPVNIYNGNGELMGTIGYNTFEIYDDTTDENYYRMVYNQIMLGSGVNWNGGYTPIKTEPGIENAVTKVMVYDYENREETLYPAVLAYDENLLVYIGIQFDVDAVTEQQLRDIAESVTFSPTFSQSDNSMHDYFNVPPSGYISYQFVTGTGHLADNGDVSYISNDDPRVLVSFALPDEWNFNGGSTAGDDISKVFEIAGVFPTDEYSVEKISYFDLDTSFPASFINDMGRETTVYAEEVSSQGLYDYVEHRSTMLYTGEYECYTYVVSRNGWSVYVTFVVNENFDEAVVEKVLSSVNIRTASSQTPQLPLGIEIDIIGLLDGFIQTNNFLFTEPPASGNETAEYNGREYYKITDKNYDTWDEWSELFYGIYTDEFASNLLNGFDTVVNIDGETYSDGGSRGRDVDNDYEYTVTSATDSRITVEMRRGYLLEGDEDAVQVDTLTIVKTVNGWRIESNNGWNGN